MIPPDEHFSQTHHKQRSKPFHQEPGRRSGHQCGTEMVAPEGTRNSINHPGFTSELIKHYSRTSDFGQQIYPLLFEESTSAAALSEPELRARLPEKFCKVRPAAPRSRIGLCSKHEVRYSTSECSL